MSGYYVSLLTAERLELCYELAPPRVKQYLRAELEHVVQMIPPVGIVLELGCGYGRVLTHLASRAGFTVGVDNSERSLKYGRDLLKGRQNISLICADAGRLPFQDNSFDLILCIQNGISAFKIEPQKLVRESLRVCKPTGASLFSTYAESFWEHRMHWFRLQSEAHLIGPINYEETRDGRIVCTDGFVATTARASDFHDLAETCGADATIYEIDYSSLFCEFRSRSGR